MMLRFFAMRRNLRLILLLPVLVALVLGALPAARAKERPSAALRTGRFLYVAEPGIRNYQQYGGIGVLVYDIANGYRFVKRIPTWTVPELSLIHI